MSNGTYEIEAGGGGYVNDTQTVTVDGAGVSNVNFSLTRAEPYIVSAAPRGNTYVQNRSVELKVTVDDRSPNSNLDVTISLENESGVFETVRSGTFVAGSTIRTDVTTLRGTNRWRVELENGAGQNASATFTFRAPNNLRVYNGTSVQLLTSETVQATFTDLDSSAQFTRSTTTGIIDMNGLPDGDYLVKLTASNFSSQTTTVEDPSDLHYALMYRHPTADASVYNQSFELDDRSGEFPIRQSWLLVQAYYDGAWRTVGSDAFGAANLATVTLDDGETYRLKVTDTSSGGTASDLSIVTLGKFTGDSDLASQVITLTIQADDTEGEQGLTNDPPLATFNYTPTAPTTGDQIDFDASGSTDNDGSIDSYEWDFDRDGTVDATGATANTTFNSAGLKYVTLRVTDGGGATSAITRAIFVASLAADANEAPRAAFTVNPTDPDPTENVTFNASTSFDPEGNITDYEWDFDGDGAFEENGTVVVQQFAAEGIYLVRLKVTDNVSQTDIAAKYLVVGDGEGPGQASYTWAAFPKSCASSSGGQCTDEERNLQGTNPRLIFRFQPGTGLNVTDFQLAIFEYQNRSSNEIYNQTWGIVEDGRVHTQPLSQSQAELTWVVEWSALIDGERVTNQVIIGSQPLSVPIDQYWLGTGMLLLLTIMAAVIGDGRFAAPGSVALTAFAGVLMFFQVVAILVPAWWVAFIIAVGGALRDVAREPT